MRKLAVLIVLAATFASLPATAQSPGVHPVSGRQIAGVMGYQAAEWLNRPEREKEENPDLAVELLALKPGMTVADIGAGTGYYSFRMAKVVGPSGKVYANDIQPQMLELMSRNKAKPDNVVTVLGAEADPKLPAACCDLVLMVDVYHELAQPQKMLRKILTELKPNGRLVLIEFRKEDPSIPIKPDHKMSVAEAKLEVEHEGYKLDQVIEKLPIQHIIIFKAAATAAP